MRFTIFIAGLALATSFGAISSHAQTTVIPGNDDPTVIIEREGKPPAVIDVNKDIKGEKPSAKSKADESNGPSATKRDAKANGDSNARIQEKSSAVTTGSGVVNDDREKKANPEIGCIKESWTDGRSKASKCD